MNSLTVKSSLTVISSGSASTSFVVHRPSLFSSISFRQKVNGSRCHVGRLFWTISAHNSSKSESSSSSNEDSNAPNGTLGMSDQAVDAFRIMRADGLKLKPSLVALNSLINAFGEDRRDIEAFTVLQYLKRKRCETRYPNVHNTNEGS